MSHIHEKIDFCSEVFIVYKDKVLLRTHDKHGIWLSVGGHIEPDEDPAEAAAREVKEEVGLDVELVGSPLKLDVDDPAKQYRSLLAPRYLGRHVVNETHEHVVCVYFARALSDEVHPEKPDDQIMWLNREDILNGKVPLVKNVRAYALAALEELGE